MKRIIFGIYVMLAALTVMAQDRFCIAKDGKATTIVVDENDWKGVLRAANNLGDDIKRVTGTASAVIDNEQLTIDNSIIVGTIGNSKLIDRLIKQKKIDVRRVKGQWESYLIDVVDGNLVIAGSDKRGTIYGIYDISQRIGVSPWYWMADAPVKRAVL